MKLRDTYTRKDSEGDDVPAGTEAVISKVCSSGNMVIEFANGAVWNDITQQEVAEWFISEIDPEHIRYSTNKETT
jgi:hypothetical protein